MKAIHTKYTGPTNTRGSRIIATAEGGHRVVIGYDHALNSEGCHGKAAKALAEKAGWTGQMIGGGMADNSMVWVFDDKYSPRVILARPRS